MNFLIIILLKATLILAISTLLLFIMRKASASLRHWVISLTFIGLLVLPAIVNLLPGWEVEVEGLKPLSQLTFEKSEEITPPSTITPPLPSGSFSSSTFKKTESKVEAIADIYRLAPANRSFYNLKAYLPFVLLLIWCLGFVFIILKIIAGIHKIHKISQLGQTFSHPSLTDKNKSVQILTHPAVNTPMTWGFKKSIILLPENATNWTEETLQTVLLHELAHIERKDYWVHIASLVSAAFYWFHPLVWWMKKRQLIEREKACDEYVLQAGLPNQNYAEQLVHVARQLFTKDLTQAPSATPIHEYALPMAQVKELKGRLHAILNFQKERFRFNKLKQWQWATFYVSVIVLLGAFTPIEKSALTKILVEEIEPLNLSILKWNNSSEALKIKLPVNALQVNHLQNVNSTESKLSFIEKENISVEAIGATRFSLPLNAKSMEMNLTNLPAYSAESKSKNTTIKTTPTEDIKGFTSWTEGKRQYRIWVSGNYHFIADAPYVEVDNDKDMIIIEEKRRNKTYLGLITKAPYDGAIIQDYQNGTPNSWSGRWKKGDPLHLWTVNGKWKFLSDKERDDWMYDVMLDAATRLQKMQRQTELFPKDKEWSTVMEAQRNFKKNRFMSSDQIAGFYSHAFVDGHKPDHMENAPDLNAIPFVESNFLKSSNKGLKKKGFTKANKTTTGGNDYSKGGARYGLVIQNFKTCRLIDFNFHLRFNDFEQVDFELSLYRIMGPEVWNRITEKPIPFSIRNGKKWVSTDLSKYDLAVDGDVLVVLEMKKGLGKRTNGGIFFSHAWGTFLNFQNGSAKKNWDYYEDHFAWYFTVEEGTIQKGEVEPKKK